MKTIFFLVMLFPFSMSAMLPNLDDISKALRNGDATALGKYFDDTVEISILDVEDLYSKGQAINKVKSFFQDVKPTGFNQVHKGSSKGKDGQYCIGDLKCQSGTYRVYIYVKIQGADSIIQELRFDKAK